jgi:hypothetical protein
MDSLLGLSSRGTNATQSEICAFQRCRILLFLRLRHFPEEKWERIDGKSRPEFFIHFNYRDKRTRETVCIECISFLPEVRGHFLHQIPVQSVQHSPKLLKAKSLCTKWGHMRDIEETSCFTCSRRSTSSHLPRREKHLKRFFLSNFPSDLVINVS